MYNASILIWRSVCSCFGLASVIYTLKTLIKAFLVSNLHYCISLLYDVSNCLLDKLQEIQNCAARMVSGAGKYKHVTPHLKRLHWLPVKFRVIIRCPPCYLSVLFQLILFFIWDNELNFFSAPPSL